MTARTRRRRRERRGISMTGRFRVVGPGGFWRQFSNLFEALSWTFEGVYAPRIRRMIQEESALIAVLRER